MSDFYPERSVFLTGHTGFKGGWLALYLASMGARVHGYGRSRTCGPSFYTLASVRDRLASETIADVRDLPALRKAIHDARPSVVLHLAARAIVREALDDPVGTIGANVLGSTNVLDAVRGLDCAVVMVTSDKVYRNDEGRALVEEDRLGGLDPYGASKAAVELIADCYRHTYGVHVATARCANVIGGGDWGAHRIVPNCLKAFDAGQPVTVHDAVRVFLHVLDAVHGYAVLAERLASGGCAGAYNFGPYVSTHVEDVASMVAGWTGNVQRSGAAPKQEAQSLVIESRKARDVLDWRPRWPIRDAVERTVAWHRAWRDGADMGLVSMEQIGEFREAA